MLHEVYTQRRQEVHENASCLMHKGMLCPLFGFHYLLLQIWQAPNAVSQKFCSQKWQCKTLKLKSIFDPLLSDTEIRNSNIETRNKFK